MSEAEARDFFRKIMSVVIKIKSNVLEAMCRKGEEPSETMLMMLNQMHPLIFSKRGELNLLEIAKTVLEKEQIEPIDLYNFVILAERSLGVNIAADMMGVKIPVINPLPEWLGGWDE